MWVDDNPFEYDVENGITSEEKQIKLVTLTLSNIHISINNSHQKIIR